MQSNMGCSHPKYVTQRLWGSYIKLTVFGFMNFGRPRLAHTHQNQAIIGNTGINKCIVNNDRIHVLQWRGENGTADGTTTPV